MNELISVIVPMYNTEEYLEKTIQSLVSQTYSNVEIILINDASTDRTAEVAERYANIYPNIMLINQEKNKGVSVARNLGLMKAKGNYITFVDSDDILTKQALEILYNTARENNADLVLGIYKNFSSKGSRLGSIFKRSRKLTEKGRVFPFSNPEIISHVYNHGKLYKKELIEGIFFPEGITFAEDQTFTIHTYLKAQRIFVAPSVVYYYREREQGFSATQLAIAEPVKTLQSIFDSFYYGKMPFEEVLVNKENYLLLLYLSKVVQETIKFVFEGTIRLNDQGVLNKIINMLIDWIELLDAYLVLGTDSFQNVFLGNGQEYMKYFNFENQQLYIKLIRLIRDKKLLGSQMYKQQVILQNKLIDFFLNTIEDYLYNNKIVKEDTYSVCYPNVTYLNELNGEAYIRFQLVEKEQISLAKCVLLKKNGFWKIVEFTYEGTNLSNTVKIKKRKPKILLTYRDFSGCNTLALYKTIPPIITERFEVELISGNQMSNSFVRKVMESDIIITTNMEYGFDKFKFDPQKIVIDLWHGFPLKNMFYTDPNYHDKNSVAPYWKQINYLLSYSNLYSEVVNKCIKVNPNNFIVTGAPRNDLLYSTESRKKLFDLLRKEDTGQKLIVYMPTFRLSDQKKEFDHQQNIFGFKDFDFNQLTTFLEENQFELIIKAHPIFSRDFGSIIEDCPYVTLIKSNDLMNQYIDFYEVLGASDLLITDYSSVYFDYLLLDKPIIFTPIDLEEYQEERGFILDSYDQWTPGPKVMNQTELQTQILKYRENLVEYRDIRNQIKDKVHFYQDSNSSERVWKFISTLEKNLIGNEN